MPKEMILVIRFSRLDGTPHAVVQSGADNDTFHIFDDTQGKVVDDTTLVGDEGDDVFEFVLSSKITIEGGEGSNTYRFEPYWLGGSYHNEVTITDLASGDTIEYFADYSREQSSDDSELDSRYDSDGNVVLYDANWDFFEITLEGITEDNLSDIADVKYVSAKKTSTLGEILEIGSGKVLFSATSARAIRLISTAKITPFINKKPSCNVRRG